MGMQQDPLVHRLDEFRRQALGAGHQIVGDMVEFKAGGAEAGQGFPQMQHAGRAPAQHLLGLEAGEAVDGAVHDLFRAALIAFPFRLDDAATGARSADHFIIDFKGVQ